MNRSSSIDNYLNPSNELKIGSCVSEDLLVIDDYDVEIVRGIDGNYWGEIDKMSIYPIEVGAIVELKNHDTKSQPGGYGFRQTDILDIHIRTEIKDGFFRKKEDALLEFVLNHNSKRKEILINVEDKQIPKILKSINYNRNFDYNKYLQTLQIPYEIGGVIQKTMVYPKTPFIAIGENILWSKLRTKGTFNRKIVWLEAITNFRVFRYNYQIHSSNYAFFSAIDEIIVTNQKRVSESQGSGMYYGTRVGSMRTGHGNTRTRSSSVTYGDVVFIVDGKPFITLSQIRDPNGLSRIAKGAKKQTLQVERMLTKGTKTKVRKTGESTIQCQGCGNINVLGANFCNSCGVGLK